MPDFRAHNFIAEKSNTYAMDTPADSCCAAINASRDSFVHKSSLDIAVAHKKVRNISLDRVLGVRAPRTREWPLTALAPEWRTGRLLRRPAAPWAGNPTGIAPQHFVATANGSAARD
ncbi:hypothetical protein AB8806_23275 [Ralstonia syzygii subsp. celebesensis]